MPVLRRLTALALVAASTVACSGAAADPRADGATATPATSPTTSAVGAPAPTAGGDPSPGRVAKPGWVTGRVLDDDGEPVVGALVETLRRRDVPEAGLLQERTPRRGWTDARGRFRIKQPADGYLVHACYPWPEDRRVCLETAQGAPYLQAYAGAAGQTDSWVTQTSPFPAAETDRRIGALRVADPATVRGRLVGQAFTQVRVMRLNDTIAFRTETDAQGRYVLRGLAAGPYYVAAGGQGTLPWRSADFTLPRGGTKRLGDTTLDPGATITGTLRTPTGVARGADVFVSRDGAELVAATTTDARGRFQVPGFTAGRYRVGILQSGGVFRPKAVWVEVAAADGSYDASLTVRRGASLVVPLRTPRDPGERRIRDELRDASGTAVQANRNDGRSVTYTGLAPGRYTIVAATADHYARRSVDVAGSGRQALAALRLRRPTFSLTGTTAPGAVTEATTGDLCPPGEDPRFGGFHLFDKADASGAFEITGLVPGTYMLGADDWPGDAAPRCWSGVELTGDAEQDLPLDQGATASGRLVYAATGDPVIANLSYELTYATATETSPTDEHPARATARDATGAFTIERLGTGAVTGALATEADLETITSGEFLVIHPFQDGTPYWLESDVLDLDVTAGDTLELGDIALRIRP